MHRILVTGCAIALGAGAFAALAQTTSTSSGQAYPVKPIRIIVTFPPGGPSDFVARALGQKLTEAWGQQIVVDNRGGAGGVVGVEAAARANPDGYTLLQGQSGGMSINPALHPKLSYDPFRDFAPVSMLVVNSQMLVAHPSLPAKTVKQLIALAKSKPGQISYASAGHGSAQHLGMEMLKAMAGIDLLHVPYKGTGPALVDLFSGQVSLQFTSMPAVLPHVKAGKLNGIAVGSAKRSPAVPEVPTVAESGVSGFEFVAWYGLFAPVATPGNIVSQINAQVVKLLGEPELSQRLAGQGAEPSPSTPEGLARYMREDHERWKKVIRAANIRVE
jgi:tripartite-type tricarboxylate transporter receptor subunit TctC